MLTPAKAGLYLGLDVDRVRAPIDKGIITRRAAQELLAWKPDVILARNTISVEKLLELKAELPIVFVSVFDPFGSGFVSEVTRPGKNITGFTTDGERRLCLPKAGLMPIEEAARQSAIEERLNTFGVIGPEKVDPAETELRALLKRPA